ncbi:hypothetical protein MKEN_00647600 [Mycena kentingensis (nom. inval.)]|nr:hypothetical protein MKEN_00647600 [Mycena kentingensis (nom. inval.)]
MVIVPTDESVSPSHNASPGIALCEDEPAVVPNPITLKERYAAVQLLQNADNLPEVFDRDGIPLADVRLGWELGSKQARRIAKWAAKRQLGCVYQPWDHELDTESTALRHGALYAKRVLKMYGGVTSAYALSDEASNGFCEGPFFWIETNNVIKEDRYTEKDWEMPMAKLGFTERPRWRLLGDCAI